MPKRRGIGHYNSIHGPVPHDGTDQWIKKEFARRLEAARVERGWNQSELARRASEYLPKPAEGQKQGHRIARDQISHYSRGISMPRPEALRAIAQALGKEQKDLVPPTVPSTATPPAFRVASVDERHVELSFNRVVSMQTLAKIVQLLNEEPQAPNG